MTQPTYPEPITTGRKHTANYAPLFGLDVRPRWPRRIWLARHAQRHPGHVPIGWNGHALQCGTCLGVPEPLLSRGAFSRWYRPRVEHIWFTKVTRAIPPGETAP